jgi:hypothetical protein
MNQLARRLVFHVPDPSGGQIREQIILLPPRLMQRGDGEHGPRGQDEEKDNPDGSTPPIA